jgi:UDP-N-acetylmuramate--alanine ligase
MKTGTYFFCGIGGSGMSALAQLMLLRGHRVVGSDRGRDQGRESPVFVALERLGAVLTPQDGSGVTPGMDAVIVSSAVEESVPDVRAARQHGVPVRKRAELLAEVFAAHAQRVAVGGTSGKSTVTGMIGHILARLGRNPTVINGAVTAGNADAEGGALGNVHAGSPDLCVIEADESDGSIALYRPTVSVLTNVSLDHKPMEELRALFGDFLRAAERAAVVNLDCATSAGLAHDLPGVVTFAVDAPGAALHAEDIHPANGGVTFRCDGRSVRLPVPGRHNVANALAAAAAARALGLDAGEALAALADFPGMRRRLEVLGHERGVTVIDDFAHNPDKIAASLAALREQPGRLLVIFQPHGYGPVRMLRDGLVDAFAGGLDPEDRLFLTEIFYAGGTVTRDVSSEDLASGVRCRGRAAAVFPDRDSIARDAVGLAREGDRIVVMGARDDTLTTFARRMLADLVRQP